MILGKPADWGRESILVIDSLSRLCDAAYDFHEAMAVGKSKMDGRAVYGNAQDDIERVIAMLTSPAMAMTTNVIVIAHGSYMDLPDGTKKIFPQAVGQKLSPKLPQYFPSYVRYKNQGGKRTIQISSDAMIDLANPKPFAMEKSYDIEDGLAKFFQALVGDPPGVEKACARNSKRV